jgi:hypothetical protein
MLAHDLAMSSGFINRLNNWPRGYPGDYETVELMLGENKSFGEEPGSFAEALTQYSLISPIVKQHTNKIDFQRNVVVNRMRLFDSGSRQKILSIACGGSMDLALMPANIEVCSAEVLLIDSDADALELSMSRLKSRGFGRIAAVNKNLFRAHRELREFGEFDVVIAGGILDYLNDRFAEVLLSRCIEEYSSKEGVVAFTSMARPNPYDGWMKYIAGWDIIPRNAQDLSVLLSNACEGEVVMESHLDQTNLSLLCTIS